VVAAATELHARTSTCPGRRRGGRRSAGDGACIGHSQTATTFATTSLIVVGIGAPQGAVGDAADRTGRERVEDEAARRLPPHELAFP